MTPIVLLKPPTVSWIALICSTTTMTAAGVMICCFPSVDCIEDCSDGTDDNSNGFVDVMIGLCGDPNCPSNVEKLLFADDDSDGLIDCDDPDCTVQPFVIAAPIIMNFRPWRP